MKRSSSMILLALALSLVACQKAPPPTDPGDPVETDPQACTADDQCVAVELQCCDACNGGEAIGVHRDHVDEVLADSPRGRDECGDTMCTKIGCAPWIPSCDDGTCAIVRGQLE